MQRQHWLSTSSRGHPARLHDSLVENSHKPRLRCFQRSQVRPAGIIELIGDDALRYIIEVRKERIYRLDDALAEKLGLEALRYMYRVLFLF